MANYISGPNFNVNKESKGSGELLSTEDLLNTSRTGLGLSNTSVYNTPYLASSIYSTVKGNYTEPLNRLYSVAYATSLVSQSGANTGTDYSEYDNFVHFGSALERLDHFKDKLQSIQYHASQSLWIQTNLNTPASLESETIHYHLNEANTLVEEFDDYDRHLYFGKGTTSWPKDADGANYDVTATQGVSWYNNQAGIASDFDDNNQNRLINTLPEYIREDANNAPALVFCDMLGQHYDNILIYAQSISNKYNTDNRLNIGASRDLVRDILKGLGVKLSKSQFQTSDLGRLYAGYFYPTGSEDIQTMVSASADIPSVKDHLDETNKRILHNIPHLLQVKGTRRGLRALVNTFGIPSDILPIYEFGGSVPGSQNFGHNLPIASSLDKINATVSGSILDGDTLSFYAQTFSGSLDDNRDSHVVEVGWSTNHLKDEYLKAQLPSTFNIDNFLGDPRDAFKKSYTDLDTRIKSILSSSEEKNLYDFLRLLKYFDNQLFSMLEEFAPARTSIRKGAIIKPHLLERNKQGLGAMEISQTEYSASIDIVEVGGSEGLVVDEDTTNTVVNITPVGPVTQVISDQRERFNGELGGAQITTTDGELNKDNPLKRSTSITLNYDVAVETNFSTFESTTVSSGEMLMWYKAAPSPLQAMPEEPPGLLPVGITVEEIDLIIQDLNPDLDGIGVSITRIESDVYSDDDALVFSTTQVGEYNIADGIYSGDVFIVEAYGYDTGNPAASITIELLNGGVSQETATGTGNVTVESTSGDFTVVSGSTLIIKVRYS